MRTIRGAAAALAALAVVSACGVGQNSDQATTTSSAAIEEPGNPWDLPIEQRPPLFDPCAEIPIEAVEEGVGGPATPITRFANHEPGELISCGWGNEEVNLSVLATWKSRDDYLRDSAFWVKEDRAKVGDRTGLRLTDKDDSFDSSCVQLFFTSRGTIWIRLDLVTGLNEFKGARFAKACEEISGAALPIVDLIPGGDLQ